MRPAYVCSDGARKRRLRGDPYHPACNELRRDSRGPNQRRLRRSPMSARFPSTRATRDPPQVRRPNRFGVPLRPKLLGRSKLYRGSRRLPGGPGLPERPKPRRARPFGLSSWTGRRVTPYPPTRNSRSVLRGLPPNRLPHEHHDVGVGLRGGGRDLQLDGMLRARVGRAEAHRHARQYGLFIDALARHEQRRANAGVG